MLFNLEISSRKCYLGHVDTFEISGVDAPSAAWLGGWSLWCRACEALVMDDVMWLGGCDLERRKGIIGYVISIPVAMTILEEEPKPALEVFAAGVEAQRSEWDRRTRRVSNDES